MLRHKYLCILVCIFLQILNFSSCEEGSTLALAIDNTMSMEDDIEQVKVSAKNIIRTVLKSKTKNIKDFVLVTINDPRSSLRISTTSTDEFLKEINNIKTGNPYGNWDCPEMALDGIKKALHYSRQGSYVYVFTDASAKDYEEVESVKRLCQKKQTQVIFVLTGDCRNPTGDKFRVYYKIAEACSGQVITVDKNEVGSVLETLEVLLRATVSIFKWVNVPRLTYYTPVPFDLDEKAEYALVSTSGLNVRLKITTTKSYWGPEPAQRWTTNVRNSKSIELIKPKPGTYYAWVMGESPVSVVVYGRTDFTFDYGFSNFDPKSLADTTKQPIAGAKQHVTVNVTDPDNSVDIKYIQILDINNKDTVVTELPLVKKENGLYISDSFVSPKTTFRIAIKGEVNRTKDPIVRYSRTNINPIFPDLTPRSAPEVTIAEGDKFDVNYGSDVVLTCNVKAHPLPEISWYASNGHKLPAESSEKAKPEYISYLRLKQVKKGEKYVCRAVNKLSWQERAIQVNVLPVFSITNNNIPKDKYNPKFGEKLEIPCKVTSNLPMTIKWFKAGEELTGGSESYSISADRSKLTLNSVSVAMQGKYTCEASLNSDRSVKDTHTTEVVIPGLASPKIKPTNRNISVTEGEKVELDCSTSQGYPKPEMTWSKTHPAHVDMSVKSEVLTIERSRFQDAGRYRCEVINPLASDWAVFDVTVMVPLKVTVSETNKIVPYDSRIVLNCDGEAYPPPKIEWKDEKGTVLSKSQNWSSSYQSTSTLILGNLKRSASYVCVVSNSGCSVEKKVNIVVLSPFHLKTLIEDKYYPKFGEKLEIPCKVTSNLPMTIKWFKAGEELTGGSESYSISADRSKLTLNSVSVAMQGKYTCEASLNSDRSVKDTHTTEVVIPGLASPKIKPTNRNISVIEGEKVELDCSTSQGYPKPEMKWSKTHPAHVDMSVKSEVLTIERSRFQDAGRYRCEAINPLASDWAVFDVTVMVPLKVTVSETNKIVPYDSRIVLNCDGEAYPPPRIEWKDEKGTVLSKSQNWSSSYQSTSTLILENLKRSAAYICVVSNSGGSVEKKVNVTVLSPFQIKTHIEGVKEISYGARETLRCDIKSDKSMTIQWYMQSTGVKSGRALIVTSDRYLVSEDGTNLTIKFMDMKTVGQYTCEASLLSNPKEKVSYNSDVKVVGLMPPKVVNASTVVNGKNFTAICRITGVPTPTISWQFKQKGSDSFHTIPGAGEELNIPQIQLSDAGFYKCIAVNFLNSTEHDFNVVVEDKPRIIYTVTDFYSLEGDLVVKIPCNVTGFPEPSIVWKKGGKTLLLDAKHVVKGGALYINTPVNSDSEEYTCEATNKLGSDSKTFNVEVTDTCIDDEYYQGDTKYVDAEQGKPKVIKCDAENSKVNSIRWYKDGVLTGKSGNTYTIDKVTVNDEGNYTCRANTNEGSISKTYVIRYGYPPSFENDVPLPINIVWQDSQQILDCRADSQPNAKYEWFHNGKLLPGINFEQKRIDDWGDFSCRASNIFGSVEKSFKVDAYGCFLTASASNPNQPLASDQDKPTWTYSMSNSDIILKEHDEIKFSCPSSSKTKNGFKIAPAKKELIAKCLSQDKFSVDGKEYRYSELQCRFKVDPIVKTGGKQCAGPSSEEVRVGFPVNGFIEAFKVCYDNKLNVPIYASTSSPALRYGIGADTSQLEWHSTPELGNRKTGNWKSEGSCKCCFTKVPLLDTNEMPLGPPQAATYTDNLNTMAVWDPTCGENSRVSWRSFNEQIKDISLSFDKWDSWTGASDYAFKNGGLIPRYLWKVMKFDGSLSVMVFVNDPAPTPRDVRCTNPCDPAVPEADQFLYCCQLDEFRDKFNVPMDMFLV